jgi:hypothetical protein
MDMQNRQTLSHMLLASKSPKRQMEKGVGSMNIEGIIKDLELYTEELRKAEEKYYDAIYNLSKLKLKLLETECNLINNGKVKGKNEQMRNAELWEATKETRERIVEAEREVDQEKTNVHYLKTKIENMQLVLKLMGK